MAVTIARLRAFRGLVFALFWLTCISVAAAQTDRHAAALAYLAKWQASSGSPGASAAVMVHGEVVFSGGVGTADLQTGLPQTGTTVHNVGSISKTQGVVALMQLVERGKVSLDAEVQTYVPWFPRKPWPITVRQILTHTSGIRSYRDGEFGEGLTTNMRHYAEFEQSTRFWRDDALLFQPGTHWLYSSYATNLIQAIIEKVTGESYEKYVTAHVWQPAGMLNTQLDVDTRVVPNRGRGYVRNGKSVQLENAPYEDVSYKYVGGGVISTDEDLCRFGEALNSGRLLGAKTLQLMYSLQLPADIPFGAEDQAEFDRDHPGETRIPMGTRQGIIFVLGHDQAGRPYAGHTGKVKGTGSMFMNFYRDAVTVAIHFNFDPGAIDKESAALGLAEFFLPGAPVNAH